MITTKELQVGNWLQCVTELGELYRFQITAFDFYTVEKGYVNHWEPIPLTPEILEKAGFSYYKDEYCEFWDLGTISGLWDQFTLTISNFPEDNYRYKGLTFTYHSMRRECKYVHDLQNIYFTLVGEELPIQL